MVLGAAFSAGLVWSIYSSVSMLDELVQRRGVTLISGLAYPVALALVLLMLFVFDFRGSNTSVYGWVNFFMGTGMFIFLSIVFIVGVLLPGALWNFKQNHPLGRVGLALILFTKAWQLGWISWLISRLPWTVCPETFAPLQPLPLM
jgi:hypothetical protein